MKRRIKKISCLAACLLIIASFGGCKVETVEQHLQRASSLTLQENVSQISSGEVAESSLDAGSSSGSDPAASSHGQASETAAETSKPAADTSKAPAASGGSSQAAAPSQSGNASSAPAGAASSAPSVQEPEPEPETITVKISVLCTLAVGNPNLNPGITLPEDGVMFSEHSVKLKPGQTAFDALQQTGLTLDYSGSPSRKNVYLRGVGGLYERDCGPASGWVFSINGKYPNMGCSNVVLNDGDSISFQFTDGTKLN